MNVFALLKLARRVLGLFAEMEKARDPAYLATRISDRIRKEPWFSRLSKPMQDEVTTRVVPAVVRTLWDMIAG